MSQKQFIYSRSILASCGAALLSGIASILTLVFYQLSGGTTEEGKQITALNDNKILGAVFFLFALMSVILVITLIVISLPHITKKKFEMNTLPNGVLLLIISVFFLVNLIVILTKIISSTLTMGGWVATIILIVLSLVANILAAVQCIIRFIRYKKVSK